jgi:hypothetical protein
MWLVWSSDGTSDKRKPTQWSNVPLSGGYTVVSKLGRRVEPVRTDFESWANEERFSTFSFAACIVCSFCSSDHVASVRTGILGSSLSTIPVKRKHCTRKSYTAVTAPL